MSQIIINGCIFFIGLGILLGSSTWVYNKFIYSNFNNDWRAFLNQVNQQKMNSAIGKFENVLCYIICWSGSFEALGLFFIGSIFYKYYGKTSERNPSGGTIVNFVYSIVISLVFKDISKFINLFEAQNIIGK